MPAVSAVFILDFQKSHKTNIRYCVSVLANVMAVFLQICSLLNSVLRLPLFTFLIYSCCYFASSEAQCREIKHSSW